MAFTNPETTIRQFMVGEGMRVADLGAGAGAYSLAVARAVGESGKVYAVDIQQELVSALRATAQEQHLKNLEAIWGDLEKLTGSTLKDAAVDAVIISNVLFQVVDKDTFLREAFRILRPKGKMLLIDWADSFNGMGPQKQDVLVPDVVRRLSESAGFVFAGTIDAGDHHYGMIFKKP